MSTITPDKLTSAVTGAPATWSAQCCEVVLTSAAAKYANSAVFATAPAIAYTRHEIILGSSGLVTNEERMVFSLHSTLTPQDLVLVYVRQAATGRVWRVRAYEASSTTAVVYTGSAGLPLDTPYRLETKWDTVNDVWEMRVDGATLFSGVLSGVSAGAKLNRVGIGATGANTGAVTYYLDNVAAADDAWIGAEAGAATTFSVKRMAAANRVAVVSM